MERMWCMAIFLIWQLLQRIVCLNVSNRVELQTIECGAIEEYSLGSICDIHIVARNTFAINISNNLRHPIDNVQLHVVLYYRYNRYQKYLIDRWEDICGYFSGKVPSPILDIILKNTKQFSNVNHTCPYSGSMTFAAKQFKMDNFIIEPLLPAGKFRADVSFTEGAKRNTVSHIKVFFSISDHRVWFEGSGIG